MFWSPESIRPSSDCPRLEPTEPISVRFSVRGARSTVSMGQSAKCRPAGTVSTGWPKRSFTAHSCSCTVKTELATQNTPSASTAPMIVQRPPGMPP